MNSTPAFPRLRLFFFAIGSLTLAITSPTLPAAENLVLPTLNISASLPQADQGYRALQATTASKSEIPIEDEAQSLQVVTPGLIRDYQVRSLDDAMRFVSGVSQANTLGTTRDAFVKRGFGSNADGSIFRDGVRSSLSHNFDVTSERVEVLKGPASLLYGALEPGGLINVVSKQPQYRPLTTLSGLAYSEGGGSLGLDTSGPIGDSGLAYRLIAERQHEDYWRNYGVDQHSLVAPSLSWTGQRASLALAYSYNDYSGPFDRGTPFVDGHPADIDYRRRLDEPWAKAHGITETASARFEYPLSDAWKSRLTHAWNNDRYRLDIAQPRSLAANGELLRVGNGADYDYQTCYSSWDLIGQQGLFGQRHDLLLGVGYEQSSQYRGNTYRNNQAARRSINIYAPVYGNLPPPSLLSPTQSNQDNDLDSISLYVKDNWHLGERWILVLGGRYQRFDQYLAQGLGSARMVRLDQREHAAVPLAGVVFQASERLSLYGNYSRSFVPNSPDGSGNTFDPEQGRSYEVGARYDLTPGLNLNLAVYDIEKTNVVVPSAIPDVSEAAGKVGSRGLEVDLSGRLAEGWEMVASYAYNDTEILADPNNQGNRLTQAPRNLGSLYLTHHLRMPSDLGNWYAGTGGRYVGERAGDNANSFHMSSYTLVDAFVRWELPLSGQRAQLQLNLDNLFDQHYYPSSVNALQVNVGEPRSARLSASISF